MKKVYTVTLTDEHRSRLRSLITAGQAAARTLTRARILLKADVCHEGGGCSDPEICQAVRNGFGDLVAYVERVSAAGPERVSQFFATGMLMNVLSSMGLTTPTEPWAQRLIEGCKETS